MGDGNLTWLIVEDDGAIQAVLEMMCDLWGNPHITLKDGRQAMEYLSQPELAAPLPDIALIDIRIPGPWGHLVSARLRQHPQIKDIGVILMTAYELEDKDEAQYLAESGADALIHKPLPSMDELYALAHQVVEQRRGQSH